MEYELLFEVVGKDEDATILEIRVVSEGYSGTTRLYTLLDPLTKWIASLAAFPKQVGQAVEFECGVRKGYGYCGVTIAAVDATGRCTARVVLESNREVNRISTTKMLDVDMGIEPNAIDAFVNELEALVRGEATQARLAGVEKF